LIQRKESAVRRRNAGYMPTFLFRYPNTGYRVQGYSAEHVSGGVADTYEPVTCAMCRRVHLVNPMTGRVLGEKDER
jgi:hypothetical protein